MYKNKMQRSYRTKPSNSFTDQNILQNQYQYPFFAIFCAPASYSFHPPVIEPAHQLRPSLRKWHYKSPDSLQSDEALNNWSAFMLRFF
ncbi:hypothetical protein B5X24_HaOG202327 [Helicoverpa armigera]|uniref:Uncharacterized protein n=1 Tax=Helicoverpa armigera TaxID=29058 RepID=A0A2W1BX79_HELAM|nr:hypothetical protein B5X24_HaOG202327 [Helicoverpa armigera]